MLNYSVGPPQPGQYSLSYSELKEDYWRFRRMTDTEFMASMVDALHFAVYTCWVKELGNEALADNGIVHELVHLLIPATAKLSDLAAIRQLFNEALELA